MSSALPPYTWEEALREFLLHKEAAFSPKTVRYYRAQLITLVRWAETEDIPLDRFGKRHMDRYLVERAKSGRRPLTIRHDCVCAKALLKWCSRNDILKRNPLAEYEVRRAPKPPRHMPTDEEMAALLRATRDYWDLNKNPAARFQDGRKRAFHRDRNFAILLGLADTACRIGEMLAFKVGDVRPREREAVVRESKGREPRVLPISPEWAEALEVWLKVRARIMAGQPDDEGWLFLTESGGKMDPLAFLRAFQRLRDFAGLPSAMCLHSIRRYSLNRLSKTDLLAAQRIAGHKETKTTLGYTELDPAHVRGAHEAAGIARAILGTRVENRRKRLI